VGYGWCVADTGGWTSSECGKEALEGAIVGGVIGLTLGLATPEEEPLQQGANKLVNTADFWANVESTTTTTTTDATTTVSASASVSNVARGNLGVSASASDLGDQFVGTEVPVHSETYGNGRIDIFSNGPKSYIESKNVQNLYLTSSNRQQMWKYADAVGPEDLQYDLHVNYVHPDFIGELDKLGIAYRLLPYIPYV